MLPRWFTEHPRSVGETYSEHLHAALGFALPMIGAGLACLVHAVFPFLFAQTGSGTVAALHAKMSRRDVAIHGGGKGSLS
ncbi:DUF6356 family protein [Novosphingobium sp. BL-52-GroH]|uniref:DUF6356 family protein n=1 Tax=Novosphingobium sp. BL-52-GroH TaxID=3349877 RepID=UPI00384BA4B2